jgi:hypothetical protein
MDGSIEKPHVVINEQFFYLEIWKLDETTQRFLESWIDSKKITKKEPVETHEKKPILDHDVMKIAHEKLIDERKKTEHAATTKKAHIGRPKKTPVAISERMCSRCKKKKSLDDFNKNQYNCKECQHNIYVEHLKKQNISSTTEQKPVFSEPTPEKTEQPTIEPVKQKSLSWTPERDQKLHDAFKKDLGPGGVYDADILPGFTMTEIRKRCQDLGLLDQYGLRPTHSKEKQSEIKIDG